MINLRKLGNMYQKPKGTKDIHGSEVKWKVFIDNTLNSIAEFYNFKYIVTPIFEHKEVFIRSVGEGSDIVKKEMYLFEDKKKRELALRPEGTAGVIRAIVENKMLQDNGTLKLFYNGPSFRYERPQKGRQRQFNQFGIELISEPSPFVDLECILFAQTILNFLNIVDIELKINFLGSKSTQTKYKKILKKYFEKVKDDLSLDSQNRLDNNVLRILDSKDENDKKLIAHAPKIYNSYSSTDDAYFRKLRTLLKQLDINFVLDTTLVRGLDYYSGTVFEFVSTSKVLGSKSTVIGGGRYENLIKEFGGPDVSGIGFGIGLERLILEAKETNDYENIENGIDLFIGSLAHKEDSKSHLLVIGLSYMLRNAGFKVEASLKPMKIRKIFSKADKNKSKFLIIIGAKDGKSGFVNVKNQTSGKTKKIKLEQLVTFLGKELENEKN